MKSGGYFVNTEIPLFNLKTAIDVMKTRPCFDPATGSGSARTGLRGHHPLGENPFALSSASGAAVERGRKSIIFVIPDTFAIWDF
jgi:hypothetical protein